MQLTKIYPVYNTLVDVFFGNGWYNHARLHRQGSKWTIILGSIPTAVSLTSLIKEVESYVKSR